MPTVKFIKENKEITVPDGANLRQEALRAGVNLYPGINGFGASINKVLNCHGFGHCGTCRVRILKGMENASPPTTMEKMTFRLPLTPACLAFIGNEETMRLACCLKVHGDMEVETGPELDLFGENFFS
ncbi:MAG: 2Fe-2S iron-sulfur cluster-binding protein [Pirellulales bacterium]